MEAYKEETKRTYNQYAEDYADRKKRYTQKYLLEDITLFIKQLRGKRILDIGSGPGRDAAFLKEKGLQVVCIDISSRQVTLCRQKGLEAYEMDFEHLDFPLHSFDGIWAYTSLLHLPKAKLDVMLRSIRDLLKAEGVFYLGMKEGAFEGWQTNANYPGSRRYVSLYTEDELKEKVSQYFTILHMSRVDVDETHRYINLLCRAK